MQAADIFKLDVQIAHAGMDQRKVHMLAHELASKFGDRKFASVHGRLLPGLQGAQRMDPDASAEAKTQAEIDAKMSKSIPSSAIFIHDSPEEIKGKIKKAYCPEKTLAGNPIVEYAEYLILRDKGMKIERPEKFGGDLDIADAEELKKIYSEGKLHPMDLKNAVAAELTALLKPCRDYFDKNKEYLEQIKEKDITR
jgi:tyrosyl-tRNA synthetase